MQDNFPLAYVGFIKQSLELTVSYVFTDTGKGLLFERFIVQCMNLIKGIVKCDAYRLDKFQEDEETKDPRAFEAAKVRSNRCLIVVICICMYPIIPIKGHTEITG